MRHSWLEASLIAVGLVLLAAAVANASPPAPVTQFPTGGNTLPGAPVFGPDADPFLGVYIGGL